MAAGVTRIADVVVPEIFTPYVQNLTVQKSALIASGAVVQDAALSAKLAGGGLTFNQPSWKDLDDDAENISTDDPGVEASPNKIGTLTEIQVRLNRNQSWSSMDLAAVLAGADAMESIANRVSDYWTRRLQGALIATVTGVFAQNALALPVNAVQNDMTIDIKGAGFVDGTTNFDTEAFMDAQQTMGDAQSSLSLVMAHSVVKNRMDKLNLIDYLPDSEGRPIASYRGMTLIVDDSLPNTAGVFETWIFGNGVIHLGTATPDTATEVKREALAGNGSGQDILINRVQWCIHPEGHAYVAAAPAGGPSNAATAPNLAHSASFNRVWPERKQIKIARLITREF